MIYNFNLGIGWASSGVEYAQSYRAKALREIGQEAKFVFTDMFPRENLQHMTANIGLLDSEVIWLYTFFTDCKTSTVTYTLKDLEKTFGSRRFTSSRQGATVKYTFSDMNGYYKVYLVNEKENRVHRVEIVSNGCLIRKDYYTYCKIYSEYYAPFDNKAHLYHRRFYNEDGTVAYEEVIDDDVVMYQFPDRLLSSKEELVAYMISCLKLRRQDVVILDRTTGIGQAIMQNASPARIGIVVHAEHFNEAATNEDHVLWNNYYEYAFSRHKDVKFYVVSTDVQNQLLKKHFKEYCRTNPKIVTIPVGCLQELKKSKKRKKHALVTASRLAEEKHIDWLIEAVAEARKEISDISLDIYGKGKEEGKLKDAIKKFHCEDYVHLCGHQNMDEIYKDYEAYVSASTSEGFGLTLMEAVGSGLPIIGFDVRYGNQEFIDHEKNGYLIDVHDKMERKERVEQLKECIVRLFTEANLDEFRQNSYEKAKMYSMEVVEQKWEKLLK